MDLKSGNQALWQRRHQSHQRQLAHFININLTLAIIKTSELGTIGSKGEQVAAMAKLKEPAAAKAPKYLAIFFLRANKKR